MPPLIIFFLRRCNTARPNRKRVILRKSGDLYYTYWKAGWSDLLTCLNENIVSLAPAILQLPNGLTVTRTSIVEFQQRLPACRERLVRVNKRRRCFEGVRCFLCTLHVVVVTKLLRYALPWVPYVSWVVKYIKLEKLKSYSPFIVCVCVKACSYV
jgi:hypothetical protein